MEIINQTESLCDVCLEKVPAFTFIKKGEVFIEKNCPKHGKFVVRHAWHNPEIYRSLVKIETLKSKAQLSLAVTSRCNLNCSVCFVKANETKLREITLNELSKVKGYQTIVLSGGEPTIRKDLPEIIGRLKKQGSKVMMLSNGIKLADPAFTRKLKKMGLECVMMQFDAINDSEYRGLRGRELTKTKERAVANLERCEIAIHFNALMLKGKISSQIKKLLDFSARHPGIKNVIFNQLWRLGRFDEKDYLSSPQILAEVSRLTGISNRDWMETTELLCATDKLLAMLSSKRRLFAKCNVKCLVLRQAEKIIPVTRIFDVPRINSKINKLSKHPNRIGLARFFLYFFLSQVVLNYFRNRNFRIFFWKLIKNLRYLWEGNLLLFDPLQCLTVTVFHTSANVDFSFVESCNYKAFSFETTDFDPACLHWEKIQRKADLISTKMANKKEGISEIITF
jgi:uncharacterized radical SAM superfamily Fe-S cluster-containing enzyme